MRSELLKDRRLALGLSLNDIALMMEVSRQEVSAWELGQKSPSAFRIPKLAEVLGIDTSTVLEYIRERKET